MHYQREIKEISNTYSLEIAYALAYLSEFPKGTGFHETNRRHINEYPSSGESTIVMHKQNLEKNPLAEQFPDIIISPMKPNLFCNGKKILNDKYIIDFNEKINPENIGKLEKTINELFKI